MPNKLFWSASHRRLADGLEPFRIELKDFIKQCENKGKPTHPWSDTALNLLDKAQEALNEGDIERGWRFFHQARLMAIYGLDGDDLEIRAKATLNEAEAKLGSWRKATVEDILKDKNKGGVHVKAEVKPLEVYYANWLLCEHFTNDYIKLRNINWQLVILAVIALFADIISLFTVPPLLGQGLEANNLNLIISVTAFGIMGATISGLISISRGGSTKARIPDLLLSSWVTLSRPIIGAVVALVIFTFLLSGLLHIGEMTPSLVLAVSFAAGFSERLVIRAVETVTGEG